YQAKPTKKHWEAIKRIFQYLKGTINMGLWYPKDNSMSLTAYADADHAGCQDSRRSTLGSAQFLRDRLLVGHQRSKDALQYLQQRLNTFPCLDVVLKSFGCNHSSKTTCNTLKSEHAAECLSIRGRYIYGSIAQGSENDY
ncbi:hypothetical protein Tco_0956618, partial [Tanacetum coccineum]